MARELRFRDVVVVIATLLVLLAAVVVPAFSRAKAKALRIQCVSNLSQQRLGFVIWSDDHNGFYPMQLSTNQGGAMEDVNAGRLPRLFQIMAEGLANPKLLSCPSDTRAPATNLQSLTISNISYFVGIDASTNRPEVLLLGDRNLAVNGKLLSGLVDLGADSSVTWTETLHNKGGNVVPSIGNVVQVNPDQLRLHLRLSGDRTNRLFFPQ